MYGVINIRKKKQNEKGNIYPGGGGGGGGGTLIFSYMGRLRPFFGAQNF